MDFSFEGNDSCNTLNPLYSRVERLASGLENVAKDEDPLILPSIKEQNTDQDPSAVPSVTQNLSITVSVPQPPQSNPSPPPLNNLLPLSDTTSPAHSSQDLLATRRVRNQTLITRPRERRARNDLEALIPARFRYPVGRGCGNANHAVFRGAGDYIRWLLDLVAALERERERERESEGQAGGGQRGWEGEDATQR